MTPGIFARTVFLTVLLLGKTIHAADHSLSETTLVVCLPSPVLTLGAHHHES